ncbi:phosphate acyltransferase PlsX [Anaerobacillus isosaccharinicus]|uniref:Phosphate acyltransferase n=1 Tax=Anaerobacillus isosaccharinicus TaxID=1532552 RepID=A0A1S2L816_9BACI|nr:phosphate acyltransferase PlsX [Anaerobacillus isosaccharinicus]MBA5587375.1 phosphate acyltransferase PlsX [Anaerobacillus isosaccharinicus]QOY34432.1 phosphate acyltransferase PlsX [Anaerobacillus isosaccharinicus]
MRIAIDAMGGDHAPKEVVKGAMAAVKEYENIDIVLVGNESAIKEHLTDQTRITIIHTDEKIESSDSPVTAIRRKKNSSMVLAIKEVKEGRADACISAGNTGALMTGGVLIVGRIKGIERPALAPMLPTFTGDGFLLIDAGANMDSKPEHLLHYGLMGSIYMQKVRNIESPRVGLLNVGTEDDKGTELTKQAFALLKEAPINFVGNVEARDLLEGVADVVVCDGFSGNVVLKTVEGTALSLFSLLKKELTSTFFNKLAAGALKPSFKKIKEKMDYTEYGGAGLFGLQAPIIKAHGSSNETAILNSIRQTRLMLEEKVVETIKAEVIKREI